MATKYAKDQPAGFVNRIERVAIVGAGGNQGKIIAEELLKTGKHTVTALTRQNSKSTIPTGANSIQVDYDSEDSVVSALKGQDFLIITMSVTAPRDTEAKIIEAAAKAGVPFVMPNWYGSDILNEKLILEYLGGAHWPARKAQIERLGIDWIAICCSFWYEHSVLCGSEFFGFDFQNHIMTFYDDGNTRINTSTMEQVGRAVTNLLSLPLLPHDESDKAPTVSGWRNKPVYISSWLLSQRDMFASINRAMGKTENDWKIVYEPSEDRYKAALEQMKSGNPELQRRGFGKAMYSRVFFPNGDGNFEKRGLANEVLGLPKEDLDEQSKIVKRRIDDGWIYVPGS